MSRLARFDRGAAVSRYTLLSVAVVLTMVAGPLWADVEVTLKSGTSLVGTVKIDGSDAVVTVDDSELRVPLAEVESIASAKSSPERQAHRLLLSALAARKTNDEGVEVIGLLAEAARLAPDDAHIAFWYATSLSDAGYGQAAHDVLEKQREAIFKAYPGMSEQLAARIKRRVEMERMPPALVERLDKLNADMAKQPANADMRQVAALFRLVDQEKQPIERSAFQTQCNNGQDENLESFDDGYFLYMFNRHRNNQEQPSNLDVTQPGLEAKSFEINGSTNRVKDAGELVVKRYDESAKVPFRVNLVDPDRKPIAGAKVTLQAMSARGGSSNHSLTTETDAQGWAEILLFPMKYSYNVTAEGFNATGGQAELKVGATEKNERFQQMHRAIRATIRLAWEATGVQGGGKTTGESTVQFGSGIPVNQYGQDQASWLRPIQQADKLTLQFVDTFFGYGGPFGQPPEPWVRVVDGEAAAEAEKKPDNDADQANDGDAKGGDAKVGDAKPADLDAFNELKLDKIDELKAKLPQPKMVGGGQPSGPRPPMVLPAELGKIYVGRLQHRDMRTGQPLQLAFKVFVEEMSTDGDAGE